MDANWVTAVVLLFGIAVAVYVVYAYLRMFKRQKDDIRADNPPPVRRTAPASEDECPAAERQPERKD